MEKIRIQDDLYHYVNQEWLDKAEIPADRPTAGGFSDLDKDVEQLLINDLNEMCKEGSYPNKYLETACTFYQEIKDVKKKNKQGIKPVLKRLAKIEKLQTVANLNRVLKDFVIEDYPLPIKVFVEADMKDSIHHAAYIQGPSTILPDASYYKEGLEDQRDAILAIWKQMATLVLQDAPIDESLKNQYIEDAIKFDALVAKFVKTSEEWSEYVDMYNPMKVSKVASLVKPLKLKKLLENLFGFVPEMVVVAEPRYFKAFKEVFNEETFELYKHWAYINELLNATSFLSEELRQKGSLYRNALMGIQEVLDVEKFAYNATSAFFSEPIGLYYGEKYFGEEAKKDIYSIVEDIIKKYQERISKNDVLKDETKQKAIIKLNAMKVKMGYPDKVGKIYDKLVLGDAKSAFEMACVLTKILKLNEIEKISKEVDRTEWHMPGHMVNAMYNPFSNDITFPAAILQAPFYSIKQSRSKNLGGIGAVIGHEISHAFDNNGAKCDENGNINNWWTKEDFKEFNKRTKAMIKEFDGIELPWGKVNGAFIVSENIADNGGMAVTIDIMHDDKDANFEEYFKNWARVWCLKAREEYLKMILATDVHAPAILRANMQPRNFTEWYDTFNVKKTDKMYLAPSKRVIIW